MNAKWQPIDTAPKDGTKILVFGGRHTHPDVVPADGDWWRYNKGKLTAIPTHWMPLPDPPKEPDA